MEYAQKTTGKRKFRKLEELNLLDDFLFHEVVASPEVGEDFCRILLRVILGKEIRKVKVTAQTSILGRDTDRHGIRMDAYVEDVSKEEILGNREVLDAEVIQDIFDIEPDKVEEKEILPRKIRYYHGLVDTKLLEIGASYKKLPNVYIIMILPYDPFGRERMVYTIKNRCIEDDTIEYEDGSVKIFLYTKGMQGNPSQNLIDMLKYIQQSTEENVVNQDIETVHTMVQHIKQKKEVGISYMKAWEWEEYIREDAAREAEKMVEEAAREVEDKAREVEDKAREAEDKAREVEKKAKEAEDKVKEAEDKTKAAEERVKVVEEAAKREQEENRKLELRAEQAEAEIKRLREELKRVTAHKVG